VARVTLKPKPVIELKRPKAASTTTTEPEEETFTGAEVDVLGEDRKPDLRRLSPPRPPKRKAHEEEEDDQDMRQKAKVPGKVKRRSQTVLEDDEDFEDADGTGAGGNAAPQVSLSLMRPPKPKSRQTQPKPAMIKSRTLSRGGSSRSQRRERREAVKPEKPELITLTGSLTVHELAQQIVVPETEIIKSLFFKGIAANINQTLDVPTAKMVAEEFEIEVETAELESEAKKVTEMLDESDLESLQSRPPVVTIMGHVDHGKTTLLDSIRKAKVAQGEAGGITQHIGAYHVDVEHAGQERQVVFLDTPGHEAFTAMRARGARVTDIAVLVVAADDGVRPQTIEAISHAQAAKVPIVVAINKIDKETANPDRVKQELMEYGLVPEEWGGEAVMVPVSAISGENLDTLLEMLLLVAEVEDLHANPDRLARGTVIEANLDKARGPVATLLIQNGTLRVGDSLVAGAVFGKVRAMIDDRSERVDAASPSFAVEVLGLSDVPQAGDEFEVYAEEKEARSVADKRAAEQRQSRLQQAMASRRVTLTSLSAQAQEGDLKELNLILKADVQGSVEAILAALQQLPQKEVQIRVLMAAPGEISETDVDLAAASSAVIVGFNTTLAPGARQAGDRLGVDIRDYDIIYKLLEDIEGAMEGLLEPEQVEEPLGEVEVRAVFPVRRGTVAGSYVLSGKVTRNCRIRVMRGGEQVYEGNLDSLKRMKEDAKEVNAGFECGIGVDNFNNWKEGDRIEAFRFTTKRRSLSHS
jgi:translation initiation factor IF-2